MRHFGLKSLCASQFDLQVLSRLPLAQSSLMMPEAEFEVLVVFELAVSGFPRMSTKFLFNKCRLFSAVSHFSCWPVVVMLLTKTVTSLSSQSVYFHFRSCLLSSWFVFFIRFGKLRQWEEGLEGNGGVGGRQRRHFGISAASCVLLLEEEV